MLTQSNRVRVDGAGGYTFDNDYDIFLDGDGNQWTPTSAADQRKRLCHRPVLSGAGDAADRTRRLDW